LHSTGIATACGLLEEQARELNIGFISRVQRGRPWVRVKSAASFDGRTALASGASQWITGPAARQDGHRWRARSCAVMIGIGTLKSDDPRLTVREVETSRQPTRIVVDRALELPLSARMLEGGNVLVVTAREDDERARTLAQAGAEVLVLPDAQNKVDLPGLMRELAQREMNEILVESGSRLSGALCRLGLVDELVVYLAPQLLGDEARGMFDLGRLSALEERIALEWRDVQRIGEDLRVVARVR
jgi:diaminohydroxyphosphoribosylaminopyrimidine deaminase/5-amino-6-(5-phosphoribosylamino)uracil reductase